MCKAALREFAECMQDSVLVMSCCLKHHHHCLYAVVSILDIHSADIGCTLLQEQLAAQGTPYQQQLQALKTSSEVRVILFLGYHTHDY